MFNKLRNLLPAKTADAHCDGPCGVYDPASARIAGEAVLSMTKKMLDLDIPDASDKQAYAAYLNTMSRYASIKEEEAHVAKSELLVLWSDYFKPPHLEANPEIHDIFWKAAKLCSACKIELSLQHAEELMAAIKNIHEIFWKSKDRDIAWYTAS